MGPAASRRNLEGRAPTLGHDLLQRGAQPVPAVAVPRRRRLWGLDLARGLRRGKRRRGTPRARHREGAASRRSRDPALDRRPLGHLGAVRSVLALRHRTDHAHPVTGAWRGLAGKRRDPGEIGGAIRSRRTRKRIDPGPCRLQPRHRHRHRRGPAVRRLCRLRPAIVPQADLLAGRGRPRHRLGPGVGQPRAGPSRPFTGGGSP